MDIPSTGFFIRPCIVRIIVLDGPCEESSTMCLLRSRHGIWGRDNSDVGYFCVTFEGHNNNDKIRPGVFLSEREIRDAGLSKTPDLLTNAEHAREIFGC